MKQLMTIALLVCSMLVVAQEKEVDPEYPAQVGAIELPPFRIMENKELKQHFVQFLQDSTYTDWFMLIQPQWEKSVTYTIAEKGNQPLTFEDVTGAVYSPQYGHDPDKGFYYLQPYHKIGPEILRHIDTVYLNRPLTEFEAQIYKIQNTKQ